MLECISQILRISNLWLFIIFSNLASLYIRSLIRFFSLLAFQNTCFHCCSIHESYLDHLFSKQEAFWALNHPTSRQWIGCLRTMSSDTPTLGSSFRMWATTACTRPPTMVFLSWDFLCGVTNPKMPGRSYELASGYGLILIVLLKMSCTTPFCEFCLSPGLLRNIW